MYQLTVREKFDSAHKLEDYPGPCKNIHGHSFLVDVTVESKVLNSMFIVMDFKELKTIIKMMTVELDHHYINEVLSIANATAEYLAKWFYYGLKNKLPRGINIVKVTVFESPDCGATYYE